MPRLDYRRAVPAAPQPQDERLPHEWSMLLLHEVNLLRRQVGLPERTVAEMAETLGHLRTAQRQGAEKTG